MSCLEVCIYTFLKKFLVPVYPLCLYGLNRFGFGRGGGGGGMLVLIGQESPGTFFSKVGNYDVSEFDPQYRFILMWT